jgi:hypothetical protein
VAWLTAANILGREIEMVLSVTVRIVAVRTVRMSTNGMTGHLRMTASSKDVSRVRSDDLFGNSRYLVVLC